ncbi:MAG TPA: helix-turn-helix domain-containing protein [Roseiflexaceae bacterium]|nr:helix-turn-helix domain-containing protein [Roseiflexaceae bacterium]
MTPRATPPAFVNLRGGELAIVPLAAVTALDDRLTLQTLIERLALVPIAGLCALGEISDAACAAADAARIPLVRLPDDCDPREVEREVQRLIGDYEAQIERRAAQLGNLLTQRALAGADVGGLLDTLAQRTGRAIGCYSAGGELRALKARGPARVALQTLQPGNTGAVAHLGQTIWVQQLGAGGDRLGALALCGDGLDEWDRLAAQQGAAVLALELSKEQAVLAAEERLRGDFVQTILTGPPSDNEALFQRGRELGYDLRRSYHALLCSPADLDTPPTRVLNAVNNALAALGAAAPTMRRADGVLCFLPALDRGHRAHELAEQLRTRLSSELPGLVVAIGKEAANVVSWPRSVREAEQAMRIGRQLLGGRQVLDFSNLGVYRLLILLRESPELWEFYRATLAAISEYDREQRAELIKTLDAFFDNLGNLARTADALHVHRNTLLYRLSRIREISGLDLDDPEDRLAIWLALKAHRVLKTLDEAFEG